MRLAAASLCVAALIGSATRSYGSPIQSGDIGQDWSDASNPNGNWAYLEGTNAMPHTTWTQAGYPQPAWAPSNNAGDYLPAWFKATQTVPGLDWLVGDVVVHSTDTLNGGSHGAANVTWTCPSAGIFSIVGGVWMCRDIGRSNTWTLSRNGITLSTGTIGSGDPYSRINPFTYDQGSGGAAAVTGLSLNSGDVIELQIARAGTSGDFAGVRLSICTDCVGTEYCFGDGSSGASCPCSNPGQSGHGCENSAATGGAVVHATGTTVPDTVVLTATGEKPTAFTIFLQGTTSIAPVVYGDGLRCVHGTLKRLYHHNAVAGAVAAPQGGDLSITARSAQLGNPIAPGSVRYYMTYYRDPDPSFCPSATFNASNAVRINW
jgi:hypothetical protein